eukprot:TRINITY_DN32399_c0_g1_i1.p1 TRINITY_DN32399_c0_g1~~TRINITY_DN32399_c0_g1_i1.p1  ORF type:complete len:897 (+),score=210.95 TRINITY_DN32399_c0_g1_i1:109-2799(+)
MGTAGSAEPPEAPGGPPPCAADADGLGGGVLCGRPLFRSSSDSEASKGCAVEWAQEREHPVSQIAEKTVRVPFVLQPWWLGVAPLVVEVDVPAASQREPPQAVDACEEARRAILKRCCTVASRWRARHPHACELPEEEWLELLKGLRLVGDDGAPLRDTALPVALHRRQRGDASADEADGGAGDCDPSRLPIPWPDARLLAVLPAAAAAVAAAAAAETEELSPWREAQSRPAADSCPAITDTRSSTPLHVERCLDTPVPHAQQEHAQDEADSGRGPPEVRMIVPERAAGGQWVWLLGRGFGGCREESIQVFCGLEHGGPLPAAETLRASDALLGFRVPEGCRAGAPVVVYSPYGKSYNRVELNVDDKAAAHALPLPEPCGGGRYYVPSCVPRGVERVRVMVGGLQASEVSVLPQPGAADASDSRGATVAFTVPSEVRASAPFGPVKLPVVLELPDGALRVCEEPLEYSETPLPTPPPADSPRPADALLETLGLKSPAPSPRMPTPRGVPAEHDGDRCPGVVWLAVPDSVQLCEVSQCSFLQTLRKLRRLIGLPRERILANDAPEEMRLGWKDWRAVCKAQELAMHYSHHRSAPETRAAAVLLKPLADCVWCAVRALDLPGICARGFETGDVIFYDLWARDWIRDLDLRDWWSRRFFEAQRLYDRLSHSGVFVAGVRGPQIMHFLRTRVKELRCAAAWSYMPKREVDFSRVFRRFGRLTPDWQKKAVQWYRGIMCNRALEVQRIANPQADLTDMLAIVARTESIALSRAHLDAEQRSWRLTMSHDLQSRGDAAQLVHPMCSGFTASLLLEAFLELERLFAKEGRCLIDQGEKALGEDLLAVEVHEVVLQRTLEFGPRDLHNWDIWLERNERPPGVVLLSSREVRSAVTLAREESVSQ